MANNHKEDAIPEVDASVQAYDQEHEEMDADLADHPSRNHAGNWRTRKWSRERSSYDRWYTLREGNYRSNYDTRYLPRDYRSNYDRSYVHRDYRSNYDRRYASRDYRSSYDRRYLPRTHYRFSYHGKYYPPRDTHRHVATDLNWQDENQCHGRGNYVKENKVRSPVEHVRFSTENLAKYHAEQSERRRTEKWRSKRSSFDGRHLTGNKFGDIFSNENHHDGRHGQETYSRRYKDHSVEHFGFSAKERSRTSCGNNGENVADSSSDLVENQKRSFGSYDYDHSALLSATCSLSLKLMEENDKNSRGSEVAVEVSPGHEKKCVGATLADDKVKMENPSFDVYATKSASLPVVKEEDAVLDVPKLVLGRAPVGYPRRKLLVLDVNGLLADIVFGPPKDCGADTCIARRAIFKRPFCSDFLRFCFERFEVGIWSSRSKKVIDRVIDYLLGDMQYKLFFCWDLSYCTGSGFKTLDNMHKELVFKELRKIWEKHDENLPCERGDYNQSNTLLLDDSPYKALLNPIHTAIFPYSFSFKDKDSDNSLGPDGDLRLYLQDLAAAEDVQKFVESHPFGQKAIDETSSSWEYYRKVISNFLPAPTVS
ncbi:Phosphoprotein phosphatase [Bertholletia excelsa]